MDFNKDCTLLATAGSDKIIRIYDEETKSLAMSLKDGNGMPGHSNRIFCTKWDPIETKILYSGGWDKTIQIYDTRTKGPVQSMLGAMITGDAIDVNKDDHILLTGCYQTNENLRLYDFRKMECLKVIDWEGKGYVEPVAHNYQETQHRLERDDKLKHAGTFIYSAQFSRLRTMILAGGSGKSEAKVFDYKTGEMLAMITNL